MVPPERGNARANFIAKRVSRLPLRYVGREGAPVHPAVLDAI
jgi:hypothetical protein